MFEEVVVIEKSRSQIDILIQKIELKSIENIAIVQSDAVHAAGLEIKPCDCIFFGFSIDNISGISICEETDLSVFGKVVDEYASMVSSDGRVIIVGSMPGDTITGMERCD